MAYPPKRTTQFERVKTGEFIKGIISDIEYDYKHIFKFQDKETEAVGVRFILKLDGYQYFHRSRWLKFNLGEKANLFKKYVNKLVANAHKDMCFDLDELKGMRVKTIWEENNDFQNIESIYPESEKITVEEVDPDSQPEEEKELDPF